MILSIRKSAACGKHAAGYRENNANELMIETVLSIRSGSHVASVVAAIDGGTTNLSIRGDQCVASTPVALGETPEVLSIRSGLGVASIPAAMSSGS